MVGNGVVPPFFRCSGCVIEQATACVNDLKKNASGYLREGCRINMMHEKYDTACCPTYTPGRGGKLRLEYVSSGFPQALLCIKSVGCKFSQVVF